MTQDGGTQLPEPSTIPTTTMTVLHLDPKGMASRSPSLLFYLTIEQVMNLEKLRWVQRENQLVTKVRNLYQWYLNQFVDSYNVDIPKD